jgi:hypothetical protein
MLLEPKSRKEINRRTTQIFRVYPSRPVNHLNRRIRALERKRTPVPGAVFMIRLFSVGLLLLHFSPVCAQNIAYPGGDPNHAILSLINSMPVGGGYSATAGATRDLQSAVQARGRTLQVNPFAARTTYCSGATYLVFVRAIQSLLPQSAFAGGLAEALAVRGQPDGVGVWGRWNANGPGTACLFHELGLGHNFTSFEAARPGDFMKIFWTDAVGRQEHGHSVIYLGEGQQDGVEMIRFWSSNKPRGYGEKSVPRNRIAYAIFSRLETPGNIERSVSLPPRNHYLGGLLAKESSIGEALGESGAQR